MEETTESAAVLEAPEAAETRPETVMEDGVEDEASDLSEAAHESTDSTSVEDRAEDSAPAADAPIDGDADAPIAPRENVVRGLLFALPVVPVGVILWAVIWDLGYMAAISMFVVSAGAAFLYRKGSGGRIGYPGLAVILGLTIVTLVLSFLGGIATDVARYLGMPAVGALGSAEFWDTFSYNVSENPDMWSGYSSDIMWALGFAALGSFSVIRSVLTEARSGS